MCMLYDSPTAAEKYSLELFIHVVSNDVHAYLPDHEVPTVSNKDVITYLDKNILFYHF